MAEASALGGAYDTIGNDGDYGAPQSSPGAEEYRQPQTAEASVNLGQFIGLQNITHLLTDKQLGDIAARCLADFDIDDTNFQSRRERIEELYKLALQAKEVKNYPFEGASNIKFPLLTKAALGFAALAYPAIVKDNSVVRGEAVGDDSGTEPVKDQQGKPVIDPDTNTPMVKNEGLKAKRAARVADFMSWQVLDDMDGWEDDMDKLLHIIPIIGCAFKKTYYDPKTKKPESRLVLPQYLIVNINAKTMESAFRTSEIIELYPNEIEENIRLELFREFDYGGPVSETKDETYKPQEGAASQAVDDDKPQPFIEMHCWLDLDDDAYKEPYIVWIHKDSREVARIMPRFDHADIIAGKPEQDAAGVVTYADIKKINAECYYEKFGFIPDPEGSIYDIGFGHLLQHINDAINTSMNQIIDSGHRYIMGGGFIGAGLRIKSGDLRFRPGEYKRADSQGAVLKDSVVPLPMPQPSPVMLKLLEFLVNAAEAIAVMAKAMNGDTPQNMPAATALATVEQGLQPFKAVFKRVHRGLKKEFARLYKLNQQYLTQDQYEAFTDDDTAMVKDDFNATTSCIVPVSDPDMVNNIEAIARANVLAQYKDDPLVDPVEVRKRIFRAMNIKDVESLVKIPPKAPDELVEAQKQALAAQAQQSAAAVEKMNRDNERADIEMALKIEETMASIQVDVSTAVKNLSLANQADKAVQIDGFMAQLTALEKRMALYGGNIGTRVNTAGPAGAQPGGGQQLAQPPGQPQGSPVPPGLPPAAQ